MRPKTNYLSRRPLSTSPLTFCRFSCGNNIHIKCVKILMDHQVKTMGLETIKCPLCRNDFGSISELKELFKEIPVYHSTRKPIHFGYKCNECNTSPIEGKCHKCTQCSALFLCDPCFTKGAHMYVFF